MQRTNQPPLVISQADARRLAITSQHLAAPRLEANEANLMKVLRSLRYLQLDPVSAAAPSHELVLWSRLGPGAVPLLDELLWRDRKLFEYWVYAAAIVLTEDYPMHRASMEAYGHPRMASWMEVNRPLHEHIVELLQQKGSVPTGGFEDRAVVPWESSGWTAGRNVERMLQFLWRRGEVMVAGRTANQRLWSLTDAYLPLDTDRTALSRDQAIKAGVELSVRALGVASEADVKQYFYRMQSKLPIRASLEQLQQDSKLIQVEMQDAPSQQPFYIHIEALELIEAIQAGNWEGRTTLLSPFDNLISDRDRTERLWGFFFRNEMYVPKAKREYGYYLMPILHGDQLVGRIAPRVDRRRQVLFIEGLYLEPTVKPDAGLYRAVTAQIADLAAYAGANAVEYAGPMPDAWRAKLVRA
ncbi:crosslink repair DNA glycosylase YcaQ family protein [Cohnella lubricantis]|uniref:YcaQ family DNA glycosylase n=1 Tax=Cohnella lubricantis TaxID=2163172 RepID=A0A841TAK5_9BACL|nr:crosslink repair DNA glycosylase YcaQ family protein [Cohnella lubricantis]MBB6678022.1 YcaQ family DNA glycosylase [Cohnella lubricantis]MBP2118143.1 uncharacterized protein YcaQ [Cohnella lubricantis]